MSAFAARGGARTHAQEVRRERPPIALMVPQPSLTSWRRWPMLHKALRGLGSPHALHRPSTARTGYSTIGRGL